ncbi:hypothetical protein MNB_SM-3-444 [hydrothermal vent metagenome]|uniref:Uncharacterized protein n=1 Tax=hydrothermal vent metagenome TaxID=652676 RepID=A0A1W1D1W2_9ZZZZ
MIKSFISLVFVSLFAFVLSGCGDATPKPTEPKDITSTKKEKAMWQQFQSEKAQKSLDEEFK